MIESSQDSGKVLGGVSGVGVVDDDHCRALLGDEIGGECCLQWFFGRVDVLCAYNSAAFRMDVAPNK